MKKLLLNKKGERSLKKIFTLFFTALLFSQVTCTSVYSQTKQNTNKQIEHFDNGSYIVTFFTDAIPDTSYGINTMSKIKTVTKTKTTEYYNNSNELMWSIQVKGTFTYGNCSAKCTKSEASAVSYYEYWKLSNKSASKSENRAIASVTAKLMKNSTVYDTIHKTVTLTCSSDGVFS